ncbi:hypothetical protein Q3G72_011878 [Acer saccharum]|nr:hypothetical protein Q3G72_011878 [Acer saccharum]
MNQLRKHLNLEGHPYHKFSTEMTASSDNAVCNLLSSSASNLSFYQKTAWLSIFYMCIPTGYALGYVYGGLLSFLFLNLS